MQNFEAIKKADELCLEYKYAEAFALYLGAKDDPLASMRLAELYFFGRGCETDFAKAFECAKNSYGKGCFGAHHILTLCYLYGKGCARNSSLARDAAQRALDMGEKAAAFSIGLCYAAGVDEDINAKAAIESFEIASLEGFDLANAALAYIYLNSKLAFSDYAKAGVYIDKLYESKSPYAFTFDGIRYYFGRGVKRDYNKAAKLFTTAKEYGSIYAIGRLADAMMRHHGIKGTAEDIIELYEQAANKGSLYAAVKLYEIDKRGIYAYGGIITDYCRTQYLEEHLKGAIEAAELGYTYAIDRLVYEGGVPKEEYTEWLLKSAKRGSAYAISYLHNTNYDQNEVLNLAIRAQAMGCADAYATHAMLMDMSEDILKEGISHGSTKCMSELAGIRTRKKEAMPLEDRLELAELLLEGVRRNSENCAHYLTAIDKVGFSAEKKAEIELALYELKVATYKTSFTVDNGCVINNKNIVTYVGLDTKVSVPSGIEGVNIDAFENCPVVEEIVFKNGLKWISSGAFRGMRNLRRVKLPKSATMIDYRAFEDCRNLTEIDLGGVKDISAYAFADCESLKSVDLPEKLEIIGRGAFQECDSLTTLVLPQGLKMLALDTVLACPNITLNEYAGVGYLGCEGNPYFAAVKLITAAEEVSFHPDTKIVATVLPEDRAPEVKKITIPQTVIYVAPGALTYASVSEVVFPPIKTINPGVFSDCKFDKIYFSEGTELIEELGVEVLNKPCSIYLPRSIKKAKKNAFIGHELTIYAPEGFKTTKTAYSDRAGKIHKNKLVYYNPAEGYPTDGATLVSPVPKPEKKPPMVLLLPDGGAVTSEGEWIDKEGKITDSFGNYVGELGPHGEKLPPRATASPKPAAPKAPTAVQKPAAPKTSSPKSKAPKPVAPKENPISSAFLIEDGVLTRYMGGGGYIDIPKTVTAIGNYAFDSRIDIRGVNIPDSVTEIRGNAFSNCSGLFEVYLPRSIRYIEREAFKNCRGLKRIHVYKGTVCHKTAFKGLKLFAVKKYK